MGGRSHDTECPRCGVWYGGIGSNETECVCRSLDDADARLAAGERGTMDELRAEVLSDAEAWARRPPITPDDLRRMADADIHPEVARFLRAAAKRSDRG